METAGVLSKSLIPYVANALSNPTGSVEHTIQQAFLRLDERIMGEAKAAIEAGHSAGTAKVRAAVGPAFAGSCALLLVYEPRSASLHIALTGDSRAVRARWEEGQDKYTADVLSIEQNASNPKEYERIAAEHPGEEQIILDAESGDFMSMGTSRTFGNHRWKWSEELIMKARSNCNSPRPLVKSKTPPYMTACPEVTTRAVQAQDFVILGSDGLWEAISSEDAVECVSRWIAARREGKSEPVVESTESRYDVNDDGSLSRTARPEDFAIEDLDNAAVCLLKNVLGGRHRYMVAGSVTATGPISRYVRDDITAQVIFFQEP